MRTVVGHQQRLDTGGLKLGPGDTRLDVPLFAQSAELEGCDYGSRLDASASCGIALITGPRGLISDAHYEGGVFNTLGDSSIQMHRDAWSLGPPGGWPACRKLKVIASFEAVGFLDWHGVGLLGMQGPVSVSDPEPYQVYCASGKVWLAIKTDLGGVQQFGADHSGGVLSFTFEVDFDAAAVTCSLGTVTASNGPLPPGSKLASQYIHPYTVGRLSPTKAANGYWCGPWADIKIAALSVWYNDVQACVLHVDQPRPQTYPGGPSLPLVSQQPGVWAHVVHESEDSVDHFGESLSVKNLWIKAHPGCPAILLGGLFGGKVVDVKIDGGKCAVASNLAGVGYPIEISRPEFANQEDCNVFLFRSTMTSAVTGGKVGYAKRCGLHFVGSEASVTSLTMAPPNPTPAKASVIQSGGSCIYTHVKDNYEYDVGPEFRMFRIEGANWDNNFPTSAKITDCSARGTPPFAPDPLLYSHTTRPGYTGAQRIVIDGQTVY